MATRRTIRHLLTFIALVAATVLAFNGGVRVLHEAHHHAEETEHEADCGTCHLIAAGLQAELPPAPAQIAVLERSPERVTRDGRIVFVSSVPIPADARGPPLS